MRPCNFDYRQARTIDEAVGWLAQANGDAKVIAGGQSLGPMLNLRLARPQLLIDIKRAEGFRELAADETTFSIGAGWRHAEIEDGVVEDPTRGLLAFVAHIIAYRAVRNRGTIGGSLAHADPAADWVSTLAALGAVIVTRGPGGRTKRHTAETFLEGAFMTRLGEADLITAIEVPRLSTGAKWAYYKICRKSGEFADAIGVVVADDARGLFRVLAGATDGPPVLLTRTAARLSEAGSAHASALVTDEIGDLLQNADEDARMLHIVAVQRALAQLQNG
jgi:carbon-monoxide dehydrogenase medium subunit